MARQCEPDAPYCCGSCTERHCCSSVPSRLNQSACTISSSYYAKSNETYWWLFGLTGVFFVLFAVLMLIGNYKKMSLNGTRNIFINRIEASSDLRGQSQMNLLRALANSNQSNADEDDHSRELSEANIYLGLIFAF
jgi:hypothetical protein